MELTDFQKKLVTLLPEMNFAMEEPMAKHTSFRIGGPVEVMAFPRDGKELSEILKIIAKDGKLSFSALFFYLISLLIFSSVSSSRLPVGSSAKMISGSETIARAIATRCF